MGQDALAESAKHHALRAALMSWLAGVWVILALLFIPWGLNPAGLLSPTTRLIAAAVTSAAAFFLLPLQAIGERHVAALRARPASGRLLNVAHEMAIATGHRPGDVLIYDSEIPNVGGFPTKDGVVVMATSGAVELLDRGELQALVAAQFAGVEDRWCQLATKAEFAWGFAIIAGIAFVPFSPLAWTAGLMLRFLPRWVENTRDLCADVAAVQATRNPAALASGLRDLRPAARSAHKLDVGSIFITASPFLVLPKRIKSSTTVNEGSKSERKYTSHEEIAVELALRADRAEALASGADPKEFTGREYRRRWSQLGEEAALTSEEEAASAAMASHHGIEEPREKLSDVAKQHFPADHDYWRLHSEASTGKTKLKDIPTLLKLAAELEGVRQAKESAPLTPLSTRVSRSELSKPSADPSGPAAGWFADPTGAPQLRWWDGSRWTEHTHASQAA